MEVLDEYDAPVPLRATFCQLISAETFERQATTHTERSLRRLFRSLDRDPALAERVVRWRKQREREGHGWASFVKARLCLALQGDLNYSNSMDEAEERWRLDQLKREMQRVYVYTRGSQSSNGKDRSRGREGLRPRAETGRHQLLSSPQEWPAEPDPAGSLSRRLPLLSAARRPEQAPRALHLPTAGVCPHVPAPAPALAPAPRMTRTVTEQARTSGPPDPDTPGARTLALRIRDH
ncbi:uncharacterized protein LOC114806078 isoform X7 [Ornithorhynchus anatinus]|uniref:uncharacterized protein LOC114806078 isoform X7 n=1 Tax=Ornithorhynchus anatinus TaxID=9258 RepID=UPI0010A7A5F6|nr:uncharacterized protein LOC114806078 isoform X7 [Ornithorhynchus anatinus]